MLYCYDESIGYQKYNAMQRTVNWTVAKMMTTWMKIYCSVVDAIVDDVHVQNFQFYNYPQELFHSSMDILQKNITTHVCTYIWV